MTPEEKTQRRIQRLEAEIDRLKRQGALDRQFLQARNDKLAKLQVTLASKRRTLAAIKADHA